MQCPSLDESHDMETVNTSDFSNQSKRLGVVDTFDLCKALSYKSSFESLNGSINFVFNLVNPLGIDGMFSERKGLQVPSAISLKTCNFRLNSSLPARVFNGC